MMTTFFFLFSSHMLYHYLSSLFSFFSSTFSHIFFFTPFHSTLVFILLFFFLLHLHSFFLPFSLPFSLFRRALLPHAPFQTFSFLLLPDSSSHFQDFFLHFNFFFSYDGFFPHSVSTFPFFFTQIQTRRKSYNRLFQRFLTKLHTQNIPYRLSLQPNPLLHDLGPSTLLFILIFFFLYYQFFRSRCFFLPWSVSPAFFSLVLLTFVYETLLLIITETFSYTHSPHFSVFLSSLVSFPLNLPRVFLKRNCVIILLPYFFLISIVLSPPSPFTFYTHLSSFSFSTLCFLIFFVSLLHSLFSFTSFLSPLSSLSIYFFQTPFFQSS